MLSVRAQLLDHLEDTDTGSRTPLGSIRQSSSRRLNGAEGLTVLVAVALGVGEAVTT